MIFEARYKNLTSFNEKLVQRRFTFFCGVLCSPESLILYDYNIKYTQYIHNTKIHSVLTAHLKIKYLCSCQRNDDYVLKKNIQIK